MYRCRSWVFAAALAVGLVLASATSFLLASVVGVWRFAGRLAKSAVAEGRRLFSIGAVPRPFKSAVSAMKLHLRQLRVARPAITASWRMCPST